MDHFAILTPNEQLDKKIVGTFYQGFMELPSGGPSTWTTLRIIALEQGFPNFLLQCTPSALRQIRM